MRRFFTLVGWVLVVTALIAVFGALTAPLLLMLAADMAVGVSIVRTASQTATPPVLAPG